MAELGLCSRREADDWIASGWVRVNGQVAAMGLQVAPTDRIEVDPAARGQQERQATILLHKPMGYVSGQAEDGHTPAVALINPRTHWREDPSRQRFSPPQLRGLAPCGRLDIDSVGLLVLTQDGRVARHLIGEDSEVEKEYLVRVHYGDIATDVQSAFPAGQLARLCHGLSLDGQALKPAKVEWQNPRAAALRAQGGQEAPDPPHVRTGGPEGGGPQAHPHRPRGAGQPARGAVALPGAERAVLISRRPQRPRPSGRKWGSAAVMSTNSIAPLPSCQICPE